MTLSEDQLLRVDALEAVLDLYTGKGKDEPSTLDVLAYAGWVLSGGQPSLLKLAEQQAALYGYRVTDHSFDPTREPNWKGRAG